MLCQRLLVGRCRACFWRPARRGLERLVTISVAGLGASVGGPTHSSAAPEPIPAPPPTRVAIAVCLAPADQQSLGIASALADGSRSGPLRRRDRWPVTHPQTQTCPESKSGSSPVHRASGYTDGLPLSAAPTARQAEVVGHPSIRARDGRVSYHFRSAGRARTRSRVDHVPASGPQQVPPLPLAAICSASNPEVVAHPPFEGANWWMGYHFVGLAREGLSSCLPGGSDGHAGPGSRGWAVTDVECRGGGASWRWGVRVLEGAAA